MFSYIRRSEFFVRMTKRVSLQGNENMSDCSIICDLSLSVI